MLLIVELTRGCAVPIVRFQGQSVPLSSCDKTITLAAIAQAVAQGQPLVEAAGARRIQ